MPESDFFVAGGTLRADIPSYVKRPADDELLQLALDGTFCYVLTPRQMGKSSLMIRTANRLQELEVRTAIVDLTQIGANVSVDEWYLSLLTQLRRRLKLDVDVEQWWQARAARGAVDRFTEFLQTELLTQIPGKVVIFIDEIDTTLKLDFRDDFFAAIRALYNARAQEPEFVRLSFVLLGVASPTDLIRDRARTPFNIGEGLVLQEFSRADAAVLQKGLDAAHPGEGQAILDRIFYWTNGHPYLTQKLCLAIAESSDSGWTDARIDELVNKLFLSEQARKETNLQFVQDRILTSPEKTSLLRLYGQILRGATISDDGQSPLQSQLKLAGLVKSDHDTLVVRNRIYQTVFDNKWVKTNSPVNWVPILVAVAATAIVVALVALGVIFYDGVENSQAQAKIGDFFTNTDPKNRVGVLAYLFDKRTPLGTEYDDQAINLFYGLTSRDDQIALFQDQNVPARDLETMIRGLENTLAEVRPLLSGDDVGPPIRPEDSNTSLIDTIVQAIRRAPPDSRDLKLEAEFSAWADARRATNDAAAIARYRSAIRTNDTNPATRFELARRLINQGSSFEALAELDQVAAFALARQSRERLPTSVATATGVGAGETPTAATPPGVPPTASSATAVPTIATTNPAPTRNPDNTTPDPDLPLPPYRSAFKRWEEMRSAVTLVFETSTLARTLAAAAASEFPNLRRILPVTPTSAPGIQTLNAATAIVRAQQTIPALTSLPPTGSASPINAPSTPGTPPSGTAPAEGGFMILADGQSDTSEVRDSIVFRVDAGNVGADALRIENVLMSIVDDAGTAVLTRNEALPLYCAFGGNELCTAFVFSENDYRWPNGAEIRDGATYTLNATLEFSSNRSPMNRSRDVIVRFTPAASGCKGVPQITSFGASPSTIQAGQSATLIWGPVENADQVRLETPAGSSPVSAPGQVLLSPQVSTAYILTAFCGDQRVDTVANILVANSPPPLPTVVGGLEEPTAPANQSTVVPQVEPTVPANQSTVVPQLDTIQMRDGRFLPAQIEVKVGTTVEWVNTEPNEGPSYTVTSGFRGGGADGRFNSGPIFPGGTFQFTFIEAGSFLYFSETDALGMDGEIIVTP